MNIEKLKLQHLFTIEQAVIIALELPESIDSLSKLAHITREMEEQALFGRDQEDKFKRQRTIKGAGKRYLKYQHALGNFEVLRQNLSDLIELRRIETNKSKITKAGLIKWLKMIEKYELSQFLALTLERSSFTTTNRENSVTNKDKQFIRELINIAIGEDIGSKKGRAILSMLNQIKPSAKKQRTELNIGGDGKYIPPICDRTIDKYLKD